MGARPIFLSDKPRTRLDATVPLTGWRAPVVIIVSPNLLRADQHRLTGEIEIAHPIPFSAPLVRGLILPDEFQAASYISSFLTGPGRDIDIRWYGLSPSRSSTDYQVLLEAEFQSLLERYALEKVPAGDLSEIALIRRELSKRLIELIANDARSLEKIEWRELEYLLAEVFERLGFAVELTPSGKDGGKDIVLTCSALSSKRTYYVEVKHWRSGKRVGPKAVRQFLNVVVDEKISGGLYLSTSGYGPKAIESLTEIERRRVRFGTGSKMVSMCKTYVKASLGLWIPEEPTEILCADTL